MDQAIIEAHVNDVLEKTNFTRLGSVRSGKVRDVYTQPDQLVLVATDRYSAFDRNLALIPFKGELLTAITRFWFEQTKDIVQNHIIVSPDPNVIVGKKCELIPIEMVVRGYLTGVTGTAIWTLYGKGEREFGDVLLPDGMEKNQKLPHSLITPTTKSDEHDRPITPKQIVEEGIMSQERWDEVAGIALKLFERGQQVAKERGLILVDTKYEFGVAPDGTIMLIDEIHTPDSSRYWQAASYEARIAAGEEPEYFDKEFLRLWFKEHCDPYNDVTLPPAPAEMIVELASRYVRIYEQLTGAIFKPDFSVPILERLGKNLEPYFIS